MNMKKNDYIVCLYQWRPPWSEKLHHASLTVRFWKTLETGIKIKQKQQDSLAEIRNILPSLPIVEQPIEVILENIKTAQTELRKIRANAVHERRYFLNELKERIAMRKTQSTLTKEKAIKIIENQQRKGRAHRKIKNTLSRGTSQTLSRIQITKEKAYINPNNGKQSI